LTEARALHALRTLVNSFQEQHPILGGWAAAGHDDRYLSVELTHLQEAADTGELHAYLVQNRLDWIEAAAAQPIDWSPDIRSQVLTTCLSVAAAATVDPRLKTAREAVGTLACSVAPVEVVTRLELARISLGWSMFKVPLDSLFDLALDRAHVLQGIRAAQVQMQRRTVRGRRRVIRLTDW